MLAPDRVLLLLTVSIGLQACGNETADTSGRPADSADEAAIAADAGDAASDAAAAAGDAGAAAGDAAPADGGAPLDAASTEPFEQETQQTPPTSNDP